MRALDLLLLAASAAHISTAHDEQQGGAFVTIEQFQESLSSIGVSLVLEQVRQVATYVDPSSESICVHKLRLALYRIGNLPPPPDLVAQSYFVRPPPAPQLTTAPAKTTSSMEDESSTTAGVVPALGAAGSV